MSVALSFALPLAAMTMAVDALPEPETGSARFAEVLVTAYVCEHLGFEVDYDGLARWGDGITEVYVAAGTAPKDALANVRRDVRAERDAFNRSYGNAVLATGITPVAVDAGLDAQYRFQKTFTDRCNALMRSSDAGGYFAPPESRLSGAELSRKTRAMIIKAQNGG